MDNHQKCHGRPQLCAPSRAPHFIKFILDDTSRDTKLKLPYKFVKKYGGELSSSASLKLRDGLEWEVQITMCGSKVWFEKGWENFTEFYSIQHGHFLVFGYQGNSKFDICIFDKTATEIDYFVAVEDDDSSCKILENCIKGSRHSEVESPVPGSLACKKDTKCSTGKPEINPIIQIDDDCEVSDVGSEEEDYHPERMHPATAAKIRKEIALQKAKDYKPSDPHFVAAINHSCFRGGYMYVPSVFSQTYLAKRPTQLRLQTVSSEGSWCVNVHYGRFGSRLQAGWPAFLRSNNLFVGDVCVFVLKDSNAFLFDAVFYRAA